MQELGRVSGLGQREHLSLVIHPAKVRDGNTGRKTERAFLYLPGSFDYEEIRSRMKRLLLELHRDSGQESRLLLRMDWKREITLCEEAVESCKANYRNMLDYDWIICIIRRPLGLARLLADTWI
ncbi:MAG: hypothetical protein ACLUVD_11750 [Mediterraneibacter faecis]